VSTVQTGTVSTKVPARRLFDSIGRKPMIAGSYIISGTLLFGTALPVPRRLAECDHDDGMLVRRALLRLGGRQLGVPHGERGFPDGDPGFQPVPELASGRHLSAARRNR
jgi:hypothetical protein